MNARASLWASMAIAASIGLAGCGGSDNTKTTENGGTPPTADQLMTEKDSLATAVTNADNARRALDSVQPTDDLIQTLNGAVTALDSAIKGLMYDETDKAEAEKSLREARAALSTARTEKGKLDTAATEQDNKDKIAKAKMLLGDEGAIELGLIGTSADNGGNIVDITDGELVIVIDGVTLITAELSKTSTPVSPLGSWSGSEYALREPEDEDDDLETMDHAKVYSNQEAAEDKAFTQNLAELPSPADGDGAYPLPNNNEDIRKHIASSEFSSSGTDTFEDDDRKFDGTFRGVMGTYECSGDTACRARRAGTKPSDGIRLVSGTWTFTPKAGATLKDEDDDYLFFGWWMRIDEDEMPTHASAFFGTEGTDSGVGIISSDDTPSGIGGSAKYNGKATGQFAIHEPIRGSGDSGEFTADVELTATFSPSHDGTDNDTDTTPETGGVTGTINGFMANGKSMPWSVELKRAGWGTAPGAFGPQGSGGDDKVEAMTVWSIDGNAAAAGGSWQGRMYDDDSDDDNNTPSTAVGVFEAKAGDTHRMVGGFGVNHSSN